MAIISMLQTGLNLTENWRFYNRFPMPPPRSNEYPCTHMKIFFGFCSGVYNIFIKQGDQDIKVGCCDNKGSFGELALMYNMPRAATVQSAGDGLLWAMDRQTFRRIVLRNAFQKRKMYEALLEKVPLLSSLNVSFYQYLYPIQISAGLYLNNGMPIKTALSLLMETSHVIF